MPLDLTSLENAVQRLREGLARSEAEPGDTQLRDGLIQRFAFTYELSHKMKAILHAHVPGREVWAFGSRARRCAKPYSDLDLAIMGEEAISLDTLAALNEAFAESDLPWKVDVVDWARMGEAFRRIVERDRVVLQRVEDAGNDQRLNGASPRTSSPRHAR